MYAQSISLSYIPKSNSQQSKDREFTYSEMQFIYYRINKLRFGIMNLFLALNHFVVIATKPYTNENFKDSLSLSSSTTHINLNYEFSSGSYYP